MRKFKFGYETPRSLEKGAWKIWHETTAAKYPIQYFLRETLYKEARFFYYGYVYEGLYYLKCLFWQRYHILKLRDDPRWMDSDAKIDLALQKVLFDFVENEMDLVNWEDGPSSKRSHDTIMECYDFFKRRWAQLDDNYNKMLSEACAADFEGDWLDKLREEEDRIEGLKESYLIAIMKVRKSMWT
jgi:hypothetical protein